MSFKNPAQRAAFFEKLKQKDNISLPKQPKLLDIPKVPSIKQEKPLGSFEKLKRSIKMPKVGN